MTDPGAAIFGEGYSYEQAEAKALALEGLMRRGGVEIARGSVLEQVVLSVADIVYRKQGDKKVLADEDVRIAYRYMIGVHELAGLLIAVGEHPDFGQLVPHLRLLNQGAALQNTWSSQIDQATNKIFELFAACLAMQCGNNVALDSPESSKGDNPDILADINGRRWGIACKVLHSTHPEGFIQHLEKGISQIERSSAEVGVVFLNLKNVIEHDRYWPILAPPDPASGGGATYGSFADPNAPFIMLNQEIRVIGWKLRDHLPAGYLGRAFEGKKSIPAFLMWAHTAASVQLGDHPVPTSVRAHVGVPVGTVKPADELTLQDLHWAALVDSPYRGTRPSTRPELIGDAV